MRIISQSGNTDVNYDNCVILVEDNIIKAQVNEKVYTMAIYSSKEKIKRVMEDLCKCYGDGYKSVQFLKDEEVGVV